MKAVIRDLLNLPSETVVGIVVRGEHLEWTTLLRGKDGVKRTGTGQIDLPPKPEAEKKEGEAEPPKAGGEGGVGPEESAALRAQAGKAGLKGDVTCGLPSEQLLLRVISLPDVPDDELQSMVQLQVDKFSPFPLETMVVSHEVIERKDGKSLVLVAAVKEEVAQAMGDALATLGIVPDCMDAEVLGWWHLFRDAGQIQTKGRQVVLIMGAALPEVIVFQEGRPIVSRPLAEGEGLSGEEFEVETARAVSYTLMSMEMEHGSDPYAVFLWHRGEPPHGLADKIKSECSCEVTLHSLDSLSPLSEGLARRMAEGARLNLAPASWHVSAESSLFRKRMIAAAAMGVGVWVVAILVFLGSFLFQQRQLGALKAEQAKWHKEAREVTEMRRRVLAVEHYMDKSHSALECLREISERLPPGLVLTSFGYNKGEELKISGEASAVSDVYTFKNQLDGSKFFVSSALNNVHLDPRRNKQVFDVDIKLPGGEL